MESPTTRVYTPARIVALVLIAILVAGLAYLRFGSTSDQVSVPAGAKAGDLKLARCDYTTEKGTYRADCGTLVVPENRADPKSRLIALPVTRIRARSAAAGEPVFRLEGGPGISNMTFPMASRIADEHDVVLVGYRGVDGSSVLDCPEVVSALKHSTDYLGEKSFRAYADGFRSCADRIKADGVDLAGYGLAQRVDDLEATRKALGYQRIDLISESAGTRTAMIYSWRYPASLHRSVMIGVNPPGHFLWDVKITDDQIGRYAKLCSKDAGCSKRTDDLGATIKRTTADFPKRWLFLPIKEGNVRAASLFGLTDSTSSASPISAPMTLDSWLAAAKGDASGFWFVSFVAGLVFPESFVWGEFAAAGRVDARVARDYFSSGGRQRDSIGDAGNAFLWGGGRLVDAWPPTPDEDRYSRVRSSKVETLTIGGSLDFQTPPQIATKELLPHLPSGHQVVLAGFGHTTDFWDYQPEASRQLLNTYFDKGEVDDSLYKPQRVDFTPSVTQAALGKGIAGTMLGLAVLVVLSLVWMARRVRKRGGFGRTTGAMLRSLYPVVLGLGGWFLGVLIVLTVMPGVPLDNQLLAVLFIGVPIGLGIYWAWVRRDSSTENKRVGLAAAGAAALVGSWLGFHASTGLFALVTAILGALAGANLALIFLDIARARSASARVATSKAS